VPDEVIKLGYDGLENSHASRVVSDLDWIAPMEQLTAAGNRVVVVFTLQAVGLM
jgi:hypothetical protein